MKKLVWVILWLGLFLSVNNIVNAQSSLTNYLINDSVKVPASTKYKNASFLRKIIMGSNYRREWATPVAMPVFHLQQQGFEIEKLGGGMQTKSLRLENNKNRDWVLRSVDKDVKGALPKMLQHTLAQKIVQDMISAEHPYAALTVGELAKAAGIVAPQPQLYYVPDDPAFGKYQKTFAHRVCFLEQREPTPDRSDTKNTEKVLEKIEEENDHLVLQKMVLMARLLDMLVADWDRHDDQWRWGVKDSGNIKYYYAIPRDRDQAFFMSRGLLPMIVQWIAMPHINSFTKKSTGLKRLNHKSLKFDKTFLNELDSRMWSKAIEDFQKRLSDSVIIASVKKMPPEIFALDSALLVNKLISRREGLKHNALKYYRYISGIVQINGSEEAELFTVTGMDKNVVVSMYRYRNDNTLGSKIYERTFLPEETVYIYLMGLQGNDKFMVDKNVSSKIKLKISGAEGNDLYDIQGNIRNTIYDFRSEKNSIIHRSSSKVHLH